MFFLYFIAFYFWHYISVQRICREQSSWFKLLGNVLQWRHLFYWGKYSLAREKRSWNVGLLSNYGTSNHKLSNYDTSNCGTRIKTHHAFMLSEKIRYILLYTLTFKIIKVYVCIALRKCTVQYITFSISKYVLFQIIS